MLSCEVDPRMKRRCNECEQLKQGNIVLILISSLPQIFFAYGNQCFLSFQMAY